MPTFQALHAYTATQDDELSFAKGDIVEGISDLGDGWWLGRAGGREGAFPRNYVKEAAGAVVDPAAVAVHVAAAPAPAEAKAARATPAATAAAPATATKPQASPAFVPGGAAASASSSSSSGAESKAAPVNRGANTVPNPVGDVGKAEAGKAGGADGGGGGGGAEETLVRRKLPRLPLAFGLWGYYLAMGSSMMMFFLGIPAITWATSNVSNEAELSGYGSVAVGIYSIVASIFVFCFEWRYGGRVPLFHDTRVPVRGIMYLILSFFLFWSVPTCMAGLTLLSAGLAYSWAVWRGEFSKELEHTKPKTTVSLDWEELARMTWKERVIWWWSMQVEGDNVGKIAIILIYVIANVWLGAATYDKWATLVATLPPPPVGPSGWAPWAKTGGMLLNFNCALILLPVLRGLLRWLNNLQIGRAGSLATYIPLRKNVKFHIVIALVLFGASFVHVFAHFINFGMAPKITLALFPSPTNPPWYGVVKYAPWVTGVIITISQFYIYVAAAAPMRRAKYEIFWWNHHWFVVFFVALIFHGPIFIYFVCVPCVLYVCERILRVRRGQHQIFVQSVKWIPPVLCLELHPKEPEAYKFVEGQYLYLCCPHVSANEWHPFTISSAEGDLTRDGYLTVHIRVHKGGWTDRLKQYFELMNPHATYPLVLTHRDAQGMVQPGMCKGPDGTQLVRVDGPHSAPSQHYGAYNTVMVIGAGIGLTPAAAIIRAVLRHKWKKGYRPEILHFYWTLRQSELNSFQWFIQLLAELEAELSRDRAAGNVPASNYIEINVYVTQVETGLPPPELKESARLDPRLAQYAQFTSEQLLAAAFLPKAKASAQFQVMAQQRPPNRLQDIWLWDGRPDWNSIFRQMKEQRVHNHIGVAFCGAAVIGKDLKKMCKEYSSVQEKVQFHLHKENF